MTALSKPRFLPLPQLTEDEIVALVKHPVATGILLLLTTRAPFTGRHAGEAPGKWTQKGLAGTFGCTERHVWTQLKWLQTSGYITRRRTQDGAQLAVARHPFRQIEPELQFRSSQEEPEPECGFQTESRTTVPVEPEPPFRFPIKDSESDSKGGKTPSVVHATTSTPPLEKPDEEIDAAIGDVERLLDHPVNDEVRKTLHSALRQKNIRPGRRRAAAQAVARRFAEKGGAHSDNASYWGQRLLAWVDPQRPPPRLSTAAPRPAAPVPAEVTDAPPERPPTDRYPPPEETAAVRERAKALLKADLRKRYDQNARGPAFPPLVPLSPASDFVPIGAVAAALPELRRPERGDAA